MASSPRIAAMRRGAAPSLVETATLEIRFRGCEMSVLPAGIRPNSVLGALPVTMVSVNFRLERSQKARRLGLTETLVFSVVIVSLCSMIYFRQDDLLSTERAYTLSWQRRD